MAGQKVVLEWMGNNRMIISIANNYKTIEHQLRKYSFEFLKVSPEPLNLLEDLNQHNPQMIFDAQKPNLLAASIVYIYLKRKAMFALRVGNLIPVQRTELKVA